MMLVRARLLAGCVLAVCIGALASPAFAADSTLVLVREAATIAGAPDRDPPAPRFGTPPESVDPPPDVPSIASAQAAITNIEGWIAWGWRAGAISIVHGLAGEETRAAVERAGTEVIAGCASAMETIDALIANLDREANAADNRDAAAVLHARRVTLPLRAARAMVWVAAARGTDDPSTRRLLGQSAELAGTVGTEHADGALERAVMLAHAAMVANAPDGLEAALGEAARAMELEDAAPSGATVLELDLLRARLAWMRHENALAGTALNNLITRSKQPDGTLDFGALVVARGTQARMVLDEGLHSRSAAVRARAISGATEIVRGVINADGTSERNSARRRGAASEALSGIAARLTEQDTWPGLVLAAATERTLSRPGADIPATARSLEAWLATSAGVDDPDADEVRLQLARAYAAIGDAPSSAKAALLAAAWVESHPTDDRAGATLALACAAGVQAQASGRLDLDRVRVLLEQVHRAPFDVPNRDQWRLTLAGVMARDLATLGPKDAITRADELVAISRTMSDEQAARAAATTAGKSAVFLAARIENEWDAWNGAGVLPDDVRRVVDSAALELDARGLTDEGHITRAEGLVVIDRFADAQVAVAGLDTARIDVLGILARAAAMRGDTDGARTNLRAIVAQNPGAARNTAAWIAGKAWRELGAYEHSLPEDVGDDSRAAELARALVVAAEFIPEGDTAAPEVRRRAGIASSVAGSWADAAGFLEPVWQANPSDVAVALALADARKGQGDAEGAFALLYDIATAKESARQLDRAYFRAWVRMLELLQAQNIDGSRTGQIQRELERLMGLPEFRAQTDLWNHAITMAKAAGVAIPE